MPFEPQRLQYTLVDVRGVPAAQPAATAHGRPAAPRTSSKTVGVKSYNMLKQIVSASWFDYVTAVVILINVLCMMAQADNLGLANWHLVDALFMVIFAVELVLRIVADRGLIPFLTDPDDRLWNIFDFLVVSFNVIEYVLDDLINRTNDYAAFVTTLRTFRVLRVLRLVRHFGQLRVIMLGLVDSVKYVSWIVLLALSFMLIFAIVCTQIIGHVAFEWGDEKDDILWYFGTVEKSMFTLFQFLTLDDWNSVVILVDTQMPAMTCVLFVYVIFMSFIMVSLFTGSMVNHMNQVSDQVAKAAGDDTLGDPEPKALFAEMFPKGYVDRESFVELFSHSYLRKQVGVDDLDFSAEEARTFFEYFDRDHDNIVSLDEFLSSCADYRRGLTVKSALKCKSSFTELRRHWETRGLQEAAARQQIGLHQDQQLEDTNRRLRTLEWEMQTCEHQVAEMQGLVQEVFGHHHRNAKEMVHDMFTPRSSEGSTRDDGRRDR